MTKSKQAESKFTPEHHDKYRTRLMRNSQWNGECLVWTGAIAGRGYGVMSLLGAQTYAHRVAYLLNIGQIGAKCVLHECDNPPCINPNHLFLGDYKANSNDASQKGRLIGNRRPRDARPQAKLSWPDVAAIRSAFRSGVTRWELAHRYKVTHASICHVIKGKTWNKFLKQSPYGYDHKTSETRG